ncbi:MAG: sigma-70 family RNA polymerase sigma factor [Pseudomonadota bacterium]|uniref:sigma-70 family RNA polymerase sigma factor n=1 Tax=Sphingomonas sp. ERG5 TaxID=1381597 RepID=UPI00054B514F|nr:sigma-70 family RNA polymerase sigma factor [Sphingomonas sp. ERG5]
MRRVSQPDESTRIFETQRPRLLRLAYRMLGSLSEAEDVVQDAWLRWQRADVAVEIPAAFLSRVVTRLCLDVIKSARVRRETYVGEWLPEPLLEMTDEEPADNLTLTLMMALERLSPLERAAFLLHDVFGVALNEVATTLDRDAGAVRQLAVRARKHVHEARPRFPVAQEEADRIAEAFFSASRSGDTQALKLLLADNVVLQSDGGGRVMAFRNPIVGIERMLRMFAGLYRKFGERGMVMLRPVWIDGLPGYVSSERGEILQTTALEIENGRITGIYIMRNPDKLKHVELALAAEAQAGRAH